MTIKELEKLPPKERIKKLKELQKKHEEEIKQAQQLIQESNAQMERDRTTEELQQFIPPQKPVEITDLFKEEESTLEQRAKEAPKLSEDEAKQYGAQVAQSQSLDEISQNVYQKEKEIHNKGYMSADDADDLRVQAHAMQQKEEEYKCQGFAYEARKAARGFEEAEHFLHTYQR